MTPDEARAMPGAFEAWRRTDGELLLGEFSWLTEYDCDMDGHYSGEESYEVEHVVMVPIRVSVGPCHEQTIDDEDDE
jgi:hypothetical protein